MCVLYAAHTSTKWCGKECNQILLYMDRSTMNDSFLPMSLWMHAFKAAVYLLN